MSNWGVVDFFCGCGGTSAGLELSGMDVLAGIDIDKDALKTYNKNFPKAIAVNQSVVNLTCEELDLAVDGLRSYKNLVFAACAPCQPFSTQNRDKNSNDTRISLLDEFHRFVDYFRPDYILIENVPGMQKVEEGPFTRFLGLLNKLKYTCDFEVKNAVDYGVPQSRKRLVLIASKSGNKIKLPTESHGKDKLPHMTVANAIKRFPPLNAGESHSKIPNHQSAGLKDITMERLRCTPEGGDRRHWPEHLLLECHKRHGGHSDVYGRLNWNKPSVTLTTKCTSISNGRYGHPSQDRALSVREAAALQSFSDDFIFIGSRMQTAKQVGNAVPVLFAKALGDQIILHNKGNG